MFRIILIALLVTPNIVFACSFSPSYTSTYFLVKPSFSFGERLAPKLPELKVESITRGYDDGNFASCSDFGVIELKVSTDEVGYDITVIESGEHKDVIAEGLYGAVKEDDGFYIRFIWLDGSKKEQEPLFIQLVVKAMSKNGELSKPVKLKIEHAGGNSH